MASLSFNGLKGGYVTPDKAKSIRALSSQEHRWPRELEMAQDLEPEGEPVVFSEASSLIFLLKKDGASLHKVAIPKDSSKDVFSLVLTCFPKEEGSPIQQGPYSLKESQALTLEVESEVVFIGFVRPRKDGSPPSVTSPVYTGYYMEAATLKCNVKLGVPTPPSASITSLSSGSSGSTSLFHLDNHSATKAHETRSKSFDDLVKIFKERFPIVKLSAMGTSVSSSGSDGSSSPMLEDRAMTLPEIKAILEPHLELVKQIFKDTKRIKDITLIMMAQYHGLLEDLKAHAAACATGNMVTVNSLFLNIIHHLPGDVYLSASQEIREGKENGLLSAGSFRAQEAQIWELIYITLAQNNLDKMQQQMPAWEKQVTRLTLKQGHDSNKVHFRKLAQAIRDVQLKFPLVEVDWRICSRQLFLGIKDVVKFMYLLGELFKARNLEEEQPDKLRFDNEEEKFESLVAWLQQVAQSLDLLEQHARLDDSKLPFAPPEGPFARWSEKMREYYAKLHQLESDGTRRSATQDSVKGDRHQQQKNKGQKGVADKSKAPPEILKRLGKKHTEDEAESSAPNSSKGAASKDKSDKKGTRTPCGNCKQVTCKRHRDCVCSECGMQYIQHPRNKEDHPEDHDETACWKGARRCKRGKKRRRSRSRSPSPGRRSSPTRTSEGAKRSRQEEVQDGSAAVKNKSNKAADRKTTSDKKGPDSKSSTQKEKKVDFRKEPVAARGQAMQFLSEVTKVPISRKLDKTASILTKQAVERLLSTSEDVHQRHSKSGSSMLVDAVTGEELILNSVSEVFNMLAKGIRPTDANTVEGVMGGDARVKGSAAPILALIDSMCDFNVVPRRLVERVIHWWKSNGDQNKGHSYSKLIELATPRQLPQRLPVRLADKQVIYLEDFCLLQCRLRVSKDKWVDYERSFFPFLIVEQGDNEVLFSQQWIASVYGFRFDEYLATHDPLPQFAPRAVPPRMVQSSAATIEELILPEEGELQSPAMHTQGSTQMILDDDDDAIQVIQGMEGMRMRSASSDEDDSDSTSYYRSGGVLDSLQRAQQVRTFGRSDEIFRPSTELS